jgi:hypothetical protein
MTSISNIYLLTVQNLHYIKQNPLHSSVLRVASHSIRNKRKNYQYDIFLIQTSWKFPVTHIPHDRRENDKISYL